MFWPYLALVSLLVFWLALYVLLTKWPRENNKSISRHAASNKDAYTFFTTIQAITGVATYLFMIYWFIPNYNLSMFFIVVYSVTALLQVSSAFIPDKIHGLKSQIHLAMANTMAVGMYLTTLILLFVEEISEPSRFLFWTTLLYMTTALVLISFKKGKPDKLQNYLFIQTAYIALFQFSILFATFL